jgi:hypothetical protein
MIDDDPDQRRPDALVERGWHARSNRRPASYAPAMPRLRRKLPTAPSDRRAKARLVDDIWRGRLIDLER